MTARLAAVSRLGATPCDVCASFETIWTYRRQKGTVYDFYVTSWLKAIDAPEAVRTARHVRICRPCLTTFHKSRQYGR